jgi:hypothetical protein
MRNETTVQICAKERWNHTKFQLTKGKLYNFSANGKWFDAGLEYGPEGGPAKSPVQSIFEWAKRRRGEPWFSLTGAVNSDMKTAFRIGSSKSGYVPAMDGELTCFANDVFWAYSNNSGCIELTVSESE